MHRVNRDDYARVPVSLIMRTPTRLLALVAVLLSFLAFGQALQDTGPMTLGIYFRLGLKDEAAFYDGGSPMTGSLVFGTDAGLPYVYNGSLWQGVPTQTSENYTLYVNGEWGNDTNNCLGADAGAACATIQGAINKAPYIVGGALTVQVANRSDGGILDYDGFFVPDNLYRVTTSGIGSISVAGPSRGILAPGIGTNDALFTACDGGGVGADGGNDPLQYSTVTVAGAGWADAGLRGLFMEMVRPDGGTFGTLIPIYDNSDTVLVPSVNLGSTYCTSTDRVRIRQPAVRITGNTPRSGVAQVQVSMPGRQTFALSDFDVVSPTNRRPLSLFRQGTFTFTNGRLFAKQTNGDVFIAGDGQSFSLTNSVISMEGARYPGHTTNKNASATYTNVFVNGGNVYGPFVNGGGTWGITNTTFYDTRYGALTVNDLTTCDSVKATLTAVRVVGTGGSPGTEWGVMFRCAFNGGANSSFIVSNSAFQNITYDAIWVQGRGAVFGYTSIIGGQNIGGYGLRLDYGASGSISTSTPTGTSGQAVLEGVPYTSAFLSTIPTFSLNPLFGSATNRCVTNAMTGGTLCGF